MSLNYSSLDNYELYNTAIEQFFLKNYIFKKVYHQYEPFVKQTRTSVSYLHSGYLKLYSSNINGDRKFYGFVPQYSVLYSTPNRDLMGKYSMAGINNTTVYTVSLSDFIDFLQTDKQLILHQLYEPYYRRNLLEIPHCDSIAQSAKYKVCVFLYQTILNFGKQSSNNQQSFYMENSISTQDIADYFDIHPNNVSTYINELKRKGIISKTKTKLTINDIRLLEEEIDMLRK